MQIQVLLIDDEPVLQEITLKKLDGDKNEFFIKTAVTGSQGLKLAKDDPPDLILLDWKLPDISGIDVLKLMRNDPQTRHIPVIMLTVVDSIQSKVAAFDEGEVDDYVVKPFHPQELFWRIRTVLRRKGDGLIPIGMVKRGLVKMDATRREVSVDGEKVELTPREFEMLFLFMKRPGKPLSREFILNHIWGFEDKSTTMRAVDMHLANLRAKLGKAGDYVKTMREVGYMFDTRRSGA